MYLGSYSYMLFRFHCSLGWERNREKSCESPKRGYVELTIDHSYYKLDLMASYITGSIDE